MGLLNALHRAQDLEPATRALATELAANAPLSILAAKRAIDALSRASRGVDLAELDALVEACGRSEDYVEGRTAFLEKRPPVFRGR